MVLVSFADLAWYNLDISLATTLFDIFDVISSLALDVCNFTNLQPYGFRYTKYALMCFRNAKNALIYYSGMLLKNSVLYTQLSFSG